MKNTKKHYKPKSEQARTDLLDRWQNTPAANPMYEGKTPAELARAILKPRKHK